MPLTLVVQVLEHYESGLIHADRIPKAITSDYQEILLAIKRHGHHVWLGGNVRLVTGVACQKTSKKKKMGCFIRQYIIQIIAVYGWESCFCFSSMSCNIKQ